MNLDQGLRRALRRRTPDAGFSARVLERVAAEERAGAVDRRRPHWWRAAAASVALAALLGGYTTHRVVEYRRGVEAREQLLEAMRIAGEKVRYAQQEVRGIGSTTTEGR